MEEPETITITSHDAKFHSRKEQYLIRVVFVHRNASTFLVEHSEAAGVYRFVIQRVA